MILQEHKVAVYFCEHIYHMYIILTIELSSESLLLDELYIVIMSITVLYLLPQYISASYVVLHAISSNISEQ